MDCYNNMLVTVQQDIFTLQYYHIIVRNSVMTIYYLFCYKIKHFPLLHDNILLKNEMLHIITWSFNEKIL